MRIETVLTWISRVLFTVGGLLFAGVFIYAVTQADSGGLTSGGDGVNFLPTDQMKVIVALFCGCAWSFMGGAGARALANAVSWPRAITGIVELLGFALMFAMPIFAISGGGGIARAAGVFVGGFAIVLVAKLVGFAMFGAKDVVDDVTQGVEKFKTLLGEQQASQVRQASGVITPVAPVFHPGPSPSRTFTPEGLPHDPPVPSS